MHRLLQKILGIARLAALMLLLKYWVNASIVAISSIHLLKVFMNIEQIDNQKVMWYLLVHITFVLSAFAMGYLDKILREKAATESTK